MSDLASLKATIKRGALVTAANWPLVVIQFVAESTFKLVLAVPTIGGALLVALALGRDVTDLVSGDLREILASVATTLLDQPLAFASFVVALLIVLVGGSALMFLVKGGTVSVLVAGDAAAGGIERAPLPLATFFRASAFSIETFQLGATRLFPRYFRLGLFLLVVYAVSGAVYLAAVFGSYQLISGTGLVVGWTLVAFLCSSVLLVWITLVNLVYLLFQMIVAIEDCSLRAAVRHLTAFLGARLREVGMVFVAVLVLVIVATAASIVATAGLGLVSFVPLVGLAVLPLQAAAWLLRGLVFQYLGLAALSTYVTLYRAPRVTVRPALVRTAS